MPPVTRKNVRTERDAFAAALIDSLRASGESRPLFYDAPQFTLSVPGDDRTVWLENFFVEFQRTCDQEGQAFFDVASTVWFNIQADPPSHPAVKLILHPFRDERHPLSYRLCLVEPDMGLWSVLQPFGLGSVLSEQLEAYDFAAAYAVWWSNQVQRGNIAQFRGLFRWLESKLITVPELRVLMEIRRLRASGRIAARSDAALPHELTWLGLQDSPSPELRQTAQTFIAQCGSAEDAVAVLSAIGRGAR